MEQTISDFLCDTCRVRPKPSMHKFNALRHCVDIASEEDGYSVIATPSGSASEFFIEPMLSCINDYDVMCHRNDELAIPTGHQVPRCLPAEFHHRVRVYQLTDTEFPSYVTVELTSELVKCNNDDYYECFPTESGFASTLLCYRSGRHGPAQRSSDASHAVRSYKFSDGDSLMLSVDVVDCIRCLVWPPQAADWWTRLRTHGWPDSTSIECIVKNGCDVVQIAHPRCRQDEWMRKHQWRLSFSRAETVLLNSWSVKQQIVHHVFRIFIKSAQLKAGTRILVHNYIIKTIMLWTCELWSPMKWNSRNIVCTSRLLILKLATCLESFKCPSFFLTRLNLLESLARADNLNRFAGNLKNITDESLCVWLIDNYIRQCAEQCPPHISSLFHDNRNMKMLPYKLKSIIKWRRRCCDEISYTDFNTVCCSLQRLVFTEFSHVNTMMSLCKYFIEHFRAIDPRLMPYYYATCFLKIASLLDCGQSASQMADVLIMLIQSGACVFSNDKSNLIERKEFTKDRNTKHVPVASSGTRSFTVCKHFRTACALMLTTRHSFKQVSTFPRLLIEISKVHLHSALQCSDVECEDFHLTSRCLLNVLLSCLYCSTAQHKIAFIHSRNAISVSSLQKHRIGFCHVERQLLPCFDVTLETILGLVLFYQFLRQIFSHYLQRNRHDDVFSADLLAFYLINLQSDVYCSNSFCNARRDMYNKYRTRLLRSKEPTVADFLLFHKFYRKTGFKGQIASNAMRERCKRHLRGQSLEFNALRLGKLLVQSAVEHLTAFRVSVSRDLGCMRDTVTNVFEAMYAYKYHLYENCFCLCEENVDRLLRVEGTRINRLLRVEETCITSAFPVTESALLHLADDECLFLIGLAKLCGIYIDLRKKESVSQLILSMYLLIQSIIKLRSSTATLKEALLKLMIVSQSLDLEWTINRAMMTFVYHKAVRHLRLTAVQHVVA